MHIWKLNHASSKCISIKLYLRYFQSLVKTLNTELKTFKINNRVRNYRGRVSNFDQSEVRKQCFLASDWLKFESLPRQIRTLYPKLMLSYTHNKITNTTTISKKEDHILTRSKKTNLKQLQTPLLRLTSPFLLPEQTPQHPSL